MRAVDMEKLFGRCVAPNRKYTFYTISKAFPKFENENCVKEKRKGVGDIYGKNGVLSIYKHPLKSISPNFELKTLLLLVKEEF